MARIIDALNKHIEQERSKLINHPIFSAIKTLDDLRIFMQWHVFAVWDFMSLTKRLQQDFANITVPWVPSQNSLITALINQIVLAEESDVDPTGKYNSHYELYIKAMQEIHANTKQIECFVNHVKTQGDVSAALKAAYVPESINNFVLATIDTATNQSSYEVLGSFFYGREDLIPGMFQTLLKKWQLNENQVPIFNYYLNRHIELDNEEHGPAIQKIINQITDNDDTNRIRLLNSAVNALRNRIEFWDALYQSQFQSADGSYYGLVNK